VVRFAGRSAGATLSPQPRIIFRLLHQTFCYWILADIADRLPQAFFSSQYVIEGFILPNRSASSAEFVDAARRAARDGLQNFRQGKSPAIPIAQSCKEQVSVIRHHDCGMQMNSPPIVVEAVP
jgi:hypothetical protein